MYGSIVSSIVKSTKQCLRLENKPVNNIFRLSNKGCRLLYQFFSMTTIIVVVLWIQYFLALKPVYYQDTIHSINLVSFYAFYL